MGTKGPDRGRFIRDGADETKKGADDAEGAMEQMMVEIRKTALMQMKFQTEMGIIQLIVKVNEAMAKMIKSAGEAIKSLAQ